jgi:hypothetical protein
MLRTNASDFGGSSVYRLQLTAPACATDNQHIESVSHIDVNRTLSIFTSTGADYVKTSCYNTWKLLRPYASQRFPPFMP